MPTRREEQVNLTYYVDVRPARSALPWLPAEELVPTHEIAIEARTCGEAVLAAREVPGVLIVTEARRQSKPCGPRWPR